MRRTINRNAKKQGKSPSRFGGIAKAGELHEPVIVKIDFDAVSAAEDKAGGALAVGQKRFRSRKRGNKK